jgi:hypothetical protein
MPQKPMACRVKLSTCHANSSASPRDSEGQLPPCPTAQHGDCIVKSRHQQEKKRLNPEYRFVDKDSDLKKKKNNKKQPRIDE